MTTVDVVVMGLGFTGLPTAVGAAQAGHRVVGVDSSPRRVVDIQRVAPGSGLTTVDEDVLRDLLSGDMLRVQDTTAALPESRTYVICVPTPPGPDAGVDLHPLLAAVGAVAGQVKRDALVLIQSTCPPGTIEHVIAPKLVGPRDLRPGEDFCLAHSPTRVDPGRGAASRPVVPRVVGGLSPRCLARATRWLTGLDEQVVPVTNIRTAELVKVFENTFRLVNISLVNELAEVCRMSDVDVMAVLDAAATKPYGFLRHQPGPGAGGDCVPVSAGFFASAARRHALVAAVVEAALSLNEAMPARTIHLVRSLLAIRALPPLRDSRVLVVGVTYKPDVGDIRQSAAVRVIEQLRLEAEVTYHDPWVPRLRLGDGTVLHSRPLDLDDVDVVLVLTRSRFVDESRLADHGVPVVDCSTGQPRLLSPGAATAAPLAS